LVPIAVCRNWVEPVKLRLTYPDLDENGKLRGTIENIRAMCEKLGLRIRYNIITRQTEITGVTFRYTKDNKDEVILSHMLSECERAGIPVSRTNLKGHLLAIADIDAYNPVLDWIESKPWDGRSRMEALFDTMELQPTQNRDLARKMLRTWLIQGAALACSDKPVSSRGVLTLVGEQYMGKTRWLERLVGPLEGMFKNGHTLDVKQRDNVLQATSVWICELGELDGTFKRSEQAAFKSFMTATEDVHRRAYAATDSQYQRRTSFVGSVNQELFLADETGNTRLWCVACIRLNADHDIDMQQLWAEALFWWRAGEQHYLDKGTMQQLKQESEAHAVVNPLEEMIQGRFAWEEGRDDPESVDWVNLRATDLLRQVGWSKLDTRSAGVAGSAATKLGAKRFRGGREVQGAWLYRVPQRKGELADLLEAAVS
jgi:putative DNA primase/helicase